MNALKRLWLREKGFLIDLAERVARTWVETFLAIWFASGVDLSHVATALPVAEKAAMAGFAAAASLILGLVARWSSGSKTNASFVNSTTTPVPAQPVAK